jgi:outer membrane protein TolC
LVAVYQNQVLVAAQEVQTALRGFLRSREQADALNRSVQAAVAATELGIGQYRGGTVNFTPVFQFQGAQVSVQDQLAVVRGNVALNLINVYRALGGGWEIRTRPEDRGAPPTTSTRPAERPSTRGEPAQSPETRRDEEPK